MGAHRHIVGEDAHPELLAVAGRHEAGLDAHGQQQKGKVVIQFSDQIPRAIEAGKFAQAARELGAGGGERAAVRFHLRLQGADVALQRCGRPSARITLTEGLRELVALVGEAAPPGVQRVVRLLHGGARSVRGFLLSANLRHDYSRRSSACTATMTGTW